MRNGKSNLFAIMVLVVLAFCGCQNNPEINIVTSKNDGAFDINAIQSAEKPHTVDETQQVKFDEVFYSTDGTVEYVLNVDEVLNNSHMPVIEVRPHYLSENDSKRVATALFGEVEFFEAQPLLDPVYSKKEIQEKLIRWAPYTSQEAVNILYGEHKDKTVDIVKSFISKYTELYEIAADETKKDPCEWKFKKIPFYHMPENEAASLDNSTETDSIQATLKSNNLPYRYIVETRNQADYKANYITAYIYDGTSPYFIDDRIFCAQLCRTEKPDEIIVESIKEQAEKMLKEMDLGNWKIDKCYVDEVYYGEHEEYIINLSAVPVLNGIDAIRQAQPSELTSDDVYAANYALTDASFCFSPNGELLSFVMHSPIDVEEVLNENVAVMDFQELMSKAKNTLSYSDYYNYDPGFLINSVEEELCCIVNICDIEYNLNRIRVPNTEANYYYVPCMTLLGSIEFSGKESKTVYYCTEYPISLVSINAVDGSVINITNQ